MGKYVTGKPPVTASRIPLQNIMVPKVVIKEGMPAFTVTTPFNKPINAEATKATKNPTKGGHPALEVRAKIMADVPSTDPTERSNSPHIMRKVMPAETIPSSATTVRMLARESAVRKRVAVSEKPMKTTTVPTIAPNSG
ncbi:MAG: hypothetical protein QXS01_05500 [Candidatus Bathyarchaeia archaeon]